MAKSHHKVFDGRIEPMTVGELIQALSAYDEDKLVVTRGFDEGGYDKIETIQPIQLVKWPVERTHTGDYDDVALFLDRYPKEDPETIEALLIDF